MPYNIPNIQRTNTISYAHVSAPKRAPKFRPSASAGSSQAAPAIPSVTTPKIQKFDDLLRPSKLKDNLSRMKADLDQTEDRIKVASKKCPASVSGAKDHLDKCRDITDDATDILERIQKSLTYINEDIREIQQERSRISSPLQEAKSKMDAASAEHSRLKQRSNELLDRLKGKVPSGSVADYRQYISEFRNKEAKTVDNLKHAKMMQAKAEQAVYDYRGTKHQEGYRWDLLQWDSDIQHFKSTLTKTRKSIEHDSNKIAYINSTIDESDALSRYRGLSKSYSDQKAMADKLLHKLDDHLDTAEKYKTSVSKEVSIAEKVKASATELEAKAVDILKSVDAKPAPAPAAAPKLSHLPPLTQEAINRLIDARANYKQNILPQNAANKLMGFVDARTESIDGERLREAAKEFAPYIAYNLMQSGQGEAMLNLKDNPVKQKNLLHEVCLDAIAAKVLDSGKYSGINKLMVKKTLTGPILDELKSAKGKIADDKELALLSGVKLPDLAR